MWEANIANWELVVWIRGELFKGFDTLYNIQSENFLSVASDKKNL